MNLTSSLYLALAAAGVLLLGCILWWYRSRRGGTKRHKPHKSYYGQRPDYAYFSKHGSTQVH